MTLNAALAAPAPGLASGSQPTEPLIQLRQVKKTYRTEAGDFLALKGINAEIYPGEFVAVIGKSGAGKTTLANMITGVDQISSGEVLVNGVSVHQMDETRRSLWRGLNLGVVYQFFQLMPMLTLLDNVLLPMDFCGLYKPRRSEQTALQLLRMVELEDHARKLPAAISGGQAQRVAIARALANDPPIIVADEPTGSLDSTTAKTVLDIFARLVENGKTIIMVTHDRSISHYATRILEMADGVLLPSVSLQKG